jgi:hypothetical protein
MPVLPLWVLEMIIFPINLFSDHMRDYVGVKKLLKQIVVSWLILLPDGPRLP